YLNKDTLQKLARRSAAWREVQTDVDAIERFLGRELGPKTVDHYLHRNLVSSAFLLWQSGQDPTDTILNAARIRRSIG
ncbi:MAG TPA: phosphoenolpyruvate carboxylase, partial [Nitrospiria bacterium]|nr:phosphoenolpyruvate carboxylase [Nitrospiria bacterium]